MFCVRAQAEDGPMYGHPFAINAQAAALAPALDSVGVALQFDVSRGQQIPQWIELIPAGTFTGRDGRQWRNENPQGILAAFQANEGALPFDIEHSSEHKAPKGEPAPAQGWVEELQERDGAIWGRVEWNDGGTELIANRQYRYYSPVFYYTKDSRDVLALKSVALTNQPNMVFKALNQHSTPHPTEGGPDMDLTKIALALGLVAAATESDILEAVNTLKTEKQTALNQAQSPDADKFVPMATHEIAVNRADAAEAKLAEQAKAALAAEIETAVNAARDAGKIAPSDVEYYTAMCTTDGGLEKFKAFAASTPGVVSTQGDDTKKPPANKGTALNAEEAQVAKLLGLSHEAFLKSKAEAAAA